VISQQPAPAPAPLPPGLYLPPATAPAPLPPVISQQPAPAPVPLPPVISQQPSPVGQAPISTGASLPVAAASGKAAAYQQCGGKSWTGPRVCENGCTCTSRGDYYSQCVPQSGTGSCSASPPSSVVVMKKFSRIDSLQVSSDVLARGPLSLVGAVLCVTLAAVLSIGLGRRAQRRTAPTSEHNQLLAGCEEVSVLQRSETA